MGQFFIINNLVYAPDISNEETWVFVQRKFGLYFPWLLTEKGLLTENVGACFSGVGEGWSGWRKSGHIASHAGFRATSLFPLDATLASVIHFFDTLRFAQKTPILVLAPSPELGLGTALAKTLTRNRTYLVVQVTGHLASRALHVKRSKWLFRALKIVESFTLRRADLILPMGEFTRNLALTYGAKPQKVILLPRPIPWAGCAEVTDLNDSPNVLYAGWLEEGKGIHILLRAMTIVREKIPNAQLFIAGDGVYKSNLEQLTDSLGLSDKVTFLGWLDPEELREAYKNSWVTVLPSIWEEGLGMVLVEASLMGRAVIGSERGGITDIIHHGENGLLVPPGDAVALADAIVTILQHRDLARQMGLAGNKIARQYLAEREAALERVREAIYGFLSEEAR